MAGVMADTPFSRVVFTWSKPTPSPGVDPDTGQIIVPPPEPPVELSTLWAPAKGSQFARQLQLMQGADMTTITGGGELVDPLVFPDGCVVGSTLEMVYNGRPYKGEITLIMANDLPIVSFGTYFEVSMKLVSQTAVNP